MKIIQIKQWEDLCRKYGSTNEGSINTKGIPFDVSTEILLPKNRIIEVKEHKDKNCLVWTPKTNIITTNDNYKNIEILLSYDIIEQGFVRVKIKTWKDMALKYKLNERGSIQTPFNFTIHMEKSLPEDRIIDIEINHNIFKWKAGNIYYDISNEMIEETIEKLIYKYV